MRRLFASDILMLKNIIDLRSDTVTRPSKAMYAAMSAAEVGDDCWGDDPTVLKLQAALAERTGKEAGLFFPSGTQCNLAGLMAHCTRGDEFIVGQEAHTYKWEGGGAAVLGSIQPHPIENAVDGSIPLDKIVDAIKPIDQHFARTRLLTLENTIDGKVLPSDYVRNATALAREKGLVTHLDGARIFNASIFLEKPVYELCDGFDTISICCSKGLGAPVGSVLVGTKPIIDSAHRWRKVLGGGMRQAGILAAACLYALDNNVERLVDDHENAARLATGLGQIDDIDIQSCATNMVFFKIKQHHRLPLQAFLKERGILTEILPSARLVTHRDIDAGQIDIVVNEVKRYFATCK
jgi:threonine aldolase